MYTLTRITHHKDGDEVTEMYDGNPDLNLMRRAAQVDHQGQVLEFLYQSDAYVSSIVLSNNTPVHYEIRRKI